MKAIRVIFGIVLCFAMIASLVMMEQIGPVTIILFTVAAVFEMFVVFIKD